MGKIDTYLIHGALGSGKTTLLQKLLKSKVFGEAVVIENEYANYNYDKDALSEEIKIYDVSGGCICCSSGRELFDSLDQIAKSKGLDTLFIETTGVASSAQLIKQLLLSNEFDENYKLTRSIFVLDALEDSLHEVKKTKVLDLAMADVIILNKIDLATDKAVKELMDFIQTVSEALIVPTAHGGADPKLIHSNSASKADSVLLKNLNSVSDYFVDHSKTTLYQVLYPTKKIPEKKLLELLSGVRKKSNVEILRVKGVFTTENNEKMSINATKSYHEIKPAKEWPKNDVIVIIGKNVTKNAVKVLEEAIC